MSNGAADTTQTAAADDNAGEWTTVTYKKPARKAAADPLTATSEPPQSDWILDWVQRASPKKVADKKVADKKGDTSKQAARRGGNQNGHSQRPRLSPEEEIQGPLPGWYKPPAWDVKPPRRDQKDKKQ